MKYLLLLAALTSFYSTADVNEELNCMALNIYHEARSESLAGQYAVADVVLNRVDSNRFPKSICEVVKQAKLWKGNPIRNKCQFSWYCDGLSDTATETNSWQQAVEIAISITLHDKFRGITEGATHYHTNFVDPYWNVDMRLIGTIGDHIFYLENR